MTGSVVFVLIIDGLLVAAPDIGRSSSGDGTKERKSGDESSSLGVHDYDWFGLVAFSFGFDDFVRRVETTRIRPRLISWFCVVMESTRVHYFTVSCDL